MCQYRVSEMWCGKRGRKIYGIAYVPRTEGRMPLVIFAHELANTYKAGIAYAQELASRGVAVYTFDFPGGSPASKSDGATTEMSAVTEILDLETVLNEAAAWEFVDRERIVVLGASQGGAVAAGVAVRNPDALAGLILLYPGLSIPDVMHREFGSKEHVPEQYDLRGWITVGKNYALDVWDLDFYAKMHQFPKPVLILHGDRDEIVPLSYAQRAAERYPNAVLRVICGAGHGFCDEYFIKVMEYIFSYLEQLGISC